MGSEHAAAIGALDDCAQASNADNAADFFPWIQVASGELTDTAVRRDWRGWFRRARRELLATGQPVRKRRVDTLDELTPQENTSRDSLLRAERTRKSAPNCSSAPAPLSGI